MSKYKFIGTEQDLIENGFHKGHGGWFERFEEYDTKQKQVIRTHINIFTRKVDYSTVCYIQDLIKRGLIVED